MFKQAVFDEPLIFELSRENRIGYALPKPFGKPVAVPKSLLPVRELNLPGLSEVDIVRHYTRLSEMNYGIDSGFYPLGSCTMKYNPKINEEMTAMSEFLCLHPDQAEETVQGALQIMYELGEFLRELGGMDAITLQPVAGAHGEHTGLLMIKKYHEKNSQTQRDEIILPDSAHGTNPATAAMCGFKVIEIPSNKEGTVDIEALKAAVSERTAGFMLTNPNTLGIFESQVKEIADIIHKAGGLLYYDGANLNANLGIYRPGDAGFDIMHFNLHKTFTIPHGGGGAGAGAVAVKKELESFLPVPLVRKSGEKYYFDYNLADTIGKMRAWHGNFGHMVRAYVYILTMGTQLKDAAEIAVLNANYMAQKLTTKYEMPFRKLRKHEFVLSAGKIKDETGVTAADISKRLLDYGQHAPTTYFPLIVPEALMIEPTETESKETLDHFCEIMLKIYEECYTNPEILKSAPHNVSVRRLDVVKGSREPVMSWRMREKYK